MIDLHCHLCFDCDDGPKTAQDSIDLAKALVDAGVTEVACTPHVRSDKGWMNTLKTQADLHRNLDAALDDANITLPRHRGAEHYLDETLFAQAFEGHVVPYGDTRWMLLELPYHGAPPDLFGLIFRIQKAGWRILLAHIERFPYVCDDDEAVERLLNSGVLLQTNLGSLAGAYSRAHKKASHRLVKRGQIAVASGDCHRAQDVKPFIEKGQKVLRKLVGDEGVERLCTTTPRGLLQNKSAEKLWP